MPHVTTAEHRVRQPADGDGGPADSQMLEKRHGHMYFGRSWPSVRARLARPVRMRRDDIPEQHVLLDVELSEHAMHDRRRRLGGPGAGHLALRRERETADACTAIAGGLADEEIAGALSTIEVARQALSTKLRFGVLVERSADAERRQLFDEA